MIRASEVIRRVRALANKADIHHGMGMGLSPYRSIVEVHRGRLPLSRNEAPGARFQFVLPLHHEDAS